MPTQKLQFAVDIGIVDLISCDCIQCIKYSLSADPTEELHHRATSSTRPSAHMAVCTQSASAPAASLEHCKEYQSRINRLGIEDVVLAFLQ